MHPTGMHSCLPISQKSEVSARSVRCKEVVNVNFQCVIEHVINALLTYVLFNRVCHKLDEVDNIDNVVIQQPPKEVSRLTDL